MPRHRLLLGLLVALCGWSLSGCARPSADSKEAQPASASAPLEITSDMWRVAEHLAAGINANIEHTLVNCTDFRVMVDRITADLEVSDDIREDFLASLPQRMDEVQTEFTNALTNLTLLRVRHKNSEVRALYRLLPRAGGVNYIDVLLVRSDDGCVRMADIYFYRYADEYSRRVRDTLMVALQFDNQGLLSRLTGRQPELLEHLIAVRDMAQAIKADQPARAMAIYRRLPEKVRKHRTILNLRLWAAEQLDDYEYVYAIEDLARIAGDDPSINLLLIDGYLIQQNFAAALECLEKLDAAVEGDPYLDCLRADYLRSCQKLPEAKAAADRALAALPKLRDSHEAVMLVALAQQRFEQAMFEMHFLKTEFGLSYDLSKQQFAGFLRSPEYQTWQAMHEATGDDLQAAGAHGGDLH